MTGASVPPTFVPNHLRPLHKECDKVRVALATVRGGGSYRDKEFSILYCPVCGLGFSDPIPTEETAHLLYDNRESCDFQPNESRFVTRLKAMVPMLVFWIMVAATARSPAQCTKSFRTSKSSVLICTLLRRQC
jgi:hypothetical protein